MRTMVLATGVVLCVLLPPEAMAQQEVTFGEPSGGELTSASPHTADSDEPYAEFVYTHGAASPDSLVFEAISDVFDPYLTVTGPNVSLEDDDGGESTNSRIITPLQAGTYRIRVSSLDDIGKFQVVVRSLTEQDRADARRSALPFALRGSASCLADPDAVDPRLYDILHPKTFTSIIERPRRPRGGGPSALSTIFRPSLTGAGHARPNQEAPETEVDRFSHISIEWDRKELLEIARSQNIAITVRARVESPTGTRNAEVWSYSTIGQQRRTVGTAIRNLVSIGTSVCGLIEAMDKHLPEIIQASDSTEALRYLKLSLPDFSTYLTNLSNPDNAPGFKIASYKRYIDPAVIVDYAQALLQTIRPIRDPSAGQTQSATLVRDFIAQANLLRPVIAGLARVIAIERNRAAPGQIAAEQLASQLKDGDLFVPETGARPGDRIIIEIENDASFDSIPRILKVPIRIVDFGLTQRTRDAFFFITRVGTGKGRASSAVADSLEAVTANGATTSASQPLSANFVPTPSITYGWSYYPRNVLGSRALTGFVKWLHPGFGINVAFPRFGDRVVRFTQADTLIGAPATVAVEEATEPINVGAGFVGALFDGAVQVTYGWNLSVDDKRRYWGLGFSFVKLAGAISGAVNE